MTLPRALRTGFLVVCAVDLGALLAGWDAAHTVAKPLLMPLLAAYVVACHGPRLLCAALLSGWGGDVLLLFDRDAAFLAGMGCFAAGHVCYLVLFKRYGRPRARGGLLGAGYAVALVAMIAALWPDLPAGMRGPVAAYSVLLTAMAYGASRLGPVAGVGGALFLLSDSLIALGVADWPRLPPADFWIMLTYVAAQYLLARGVLGERAEPAAAYREKRAETRRTPH
ncbi:lysoplasmalogenase [Streptomyces kunmingensis]|uniref:Lysoplasmalogenase n=1 Tax=Streptomyces kunmingensis TaxID=68225 RepID=A0ABU6CL49_9ACTN|nr:lysoplasmalogenase [Streptomyces kunmingensis]MEB3964625.1 lysoplasmalogenase [Streptomyces kunmingensis]